VADNLRWFKVWTSIVADPHFQSLPLEDVGRWALLGALTALSGTRGVLNNPEDCRMLCQLLRCTKEELIGVIKRLPNVSFEEGKNRYGEKAVTWKNWRKYQGDSTVAHRMKELRYKRRGDKKRREESLSSVPTVLQKGTPKGVSSPRAEMTPQEFIESWNEICASEGLPAVKDLSNGRRKKIAARLRRYPSVDFWEQVFNGVNRSDFLSGRKPSAEHPNWRATIDWLIENDENPLKVVEGSYA
jgi:hypothetical protein